MKSSLPPPTKEESDRIKRMLDEIGCVITFMRWDVWTPAEVHHIVEGNRRLGHLYTIPLTPWFHRGVYDSRTIKKSDMVRLYGAPISDGSKAFFESHKMTEWDYWRAIQRMLGLPEDMPASKSLPRSAA